MSRKYIRCCVLKGTCASHSYHLDKLFVSGSLDGSIVVWQSETLAPLRVLEFPEKYFDDQSLSHGYIFPVNHFTLLSYRYLCAAIGRGFRVYDVTQGDCVVECKEAHDAAVLRLVPLYKGSRLVSCSADSLIRVWELPKGIRSKTHSRRRPKSPPAQPRPMGDMLGHSGAVYDLIALSDNSVASCGADSLVVLWKDGRVQSELRNQAASAWIVHYSQMREDPSEKQEPKHNSFSDLRYLLLARRKYMDDHKEEPSEEESEEEDPVVQREMTWPYSFVNKRISIPRELGKRAAANQ